MTELVPRRALLMLPLLAMTMLLRCAHGEERGLPVGSNAHWEKLTAQQITESPFEPGLTQPSVRYSHSSVVWGDLVVVSHGYYYNRFTSPSWPAWLRDTWAYSMATGRWKILNDGRGIAPMPRMGHDATLHGDYMYIFGGTRHDSDAEKAATDCIESFHNDLWRLDLRTREWQQRSAESVSKQSWPSARTSLVLETMDDILVMHGGLRRNDTWIYSIADSTWNEVKIQLHTPHPGDRYGAASAVFGRRLYLFGGSCHSCEHECMNDLWYLDVDTSSWHAAFSCDTIASLPAPSYPAARGYSSGAALTIGVQKTLHMVVFGGCDCTRGGCQCRNDTWSFDVVQERWDKVKLQSEDSPTWRYRHTMVQWKNRLVVFGGESYNPYMYYNDLWVLHGLTVA